MMPLGTPSQVSALRARMWDAGFRPVPIYNPDADHPSAGKAPMGDRWGDEARADPPGAVRNAAHPAALNTGVLADGLRAIDIDIDNPTIAASVKAKALDMFGEAPMRYRQNSPRVLLLYRAAEGSPGKRSVAGNFGKVEVLGKGQQFVAHGVHPSGADLHWMPDAPGDIAADDLPALTEAQIDAFLAAVAPSVGAKAPTPQTSPPRASQRGLGADPLQVIAALSAIPNDGPPDWEAWNRIGMATWAATGGGEAGRAAFHAWSQANAAYDPAETNARWDHYATSPPTQIGAGTLFYLSRGVQRELDDAPADYPDDPGYWGELSEPEPLRAPVDAPRARRLELVYFADIEPSVEARDFIQGTLEEGAAAVVFGESNSGKTFWATDLALHVSAGIEWRGRRVDQGGVVYCALEGGRGFRNRVAAWKARHDGHEGPIHFAAIQSGINLLNPEADTETLIERILEAAQTLGAAIKLIVIDTLSRALSGGDENSGVDMGSLVANMDRIRARTGVCVLFIHHSGKDAAKGARGWSGLRAAIDTEIEVEAGEGAARTARVVKQREMQKGDEHSFTLEVVEIGTNQHGEPVTTCLVKHSGDGVNAGASLSRRRLPQSQQRALEVLADLVAGSGQSGHAGTPAGIPSVPEKWWRERFDERAMPGAERKTKEKAFRRAADALVSGRCVGMAAGRVWVISFQDEDQKENA